MGLGMELILECAIAVTVVGGSQFRELLRREQSGEESIQEKLNMRH